MLYIYESSVTFHFLGFFLSMVSLFFHCVTVKTLFMFIFYPTKNWGVPHPWSCCRRFLENWEDVVKMCPKKVPAKIMMTKRKIFRIFTECKGPSRTLIIVTSLKGFRYHATGQVHEPQNHRLKFRKSFMQRRSQCPFNRTFQKLRIRRLVSLCTAAPLLDFVCGERVAVQSFLTAGHLER